MKRLIILTAILTIALSYPAMAYPQYSEESKQLGRQAGLEYDVPLEEIMRRQEALKGGQANKTTPNTSEGQEKANKTLKSRNDEYHIANGTGKQSVKVTDTDDLHIYSNDYNSPSNYGAKYSYDEFRVGGKDTLANDGYGEGAIDELHINENYRQYVWHPKNRGNRIKDFDEFKYPDEL